jgi:hypothetical protein
MPPPCPCSGCANDEAAALGLHLRSGIGPHGGGIGGKAHALCGEDLGAIERQGFTAEVQPAIHKMGMPGDGGAAGAVKSGEEGAFAGDGRGRVRD